MIISINYQEFMDEAQLAAYKAIMSRMNPSPAKSELSEDINSKSEIV
jgi:hypothetical protein